MDRRTRIFQALALDIKRHKKSALDADPLTRLYHLGAVDALESMERHLGHELDMMESDAVVRGMDRADVIWKREIEKARALRG